MPDDIRLNITAEDDGARRLIEQLTRALQQLFRQQQQSARSAARSASSAQQQATAARQQVAAQRQQIASMRQATAQAQQNLAQIRLQTVQTANHTQQLRLQAQALRNAAQQQAQLRRQSQQTTGAIQNNTSATSAFIRRLAALAATMVAFRGFAAFIKEGLRFNEVVQTAELGIGALITATSEISDPFGRVLKDAEALSVAIGLAERQVQKLRVAGLQTAATTEELVQAYQSATAAGIAAGLSLDEIRKITVQIVQAAGAIGLPMQQLEQEVRSILDATIDRNSRVARVLNITNEQVRLAKSQNTLADMLNRKLQAFNVAGEEAMNTWRVIKSNIQEAFQVFAGTATEPFFDQLTKTGKAALLQVFDMDASEISRRFLPIVQAMQIFFDEMGHRAAQFVEGALRSAERLGQWFDENKEAVRSFSIAFFDSLEQARIFFTETGDLLGELIELITGGEGLIGAFDALSGAIGTFAAIISVAADGIERLGEVLGGPEMIGGITAIVGVLVALVNPVVGAKIALTGLGIAVAGVAAEIGKKNRLLGESARALDTEFRNNQRAIRQTGTLIQELQSLDDTIKETNDEKERTSALRRQAEVIERLLELHPDWREEIDKARESGKNLREEIERLTRAMVGQQQARVFLIERLAEIQAEDLRLLLLIQKTSKDTSAETQALIDQETQKLAALNAERRRAVELLDQSLLLLDSISGVSVKPTVRNPDNDAAKRALNDFTQAARARIDRIKEELKTFEELQKAAFDTFQMGIDHYFNSLTQESAAATQEIIGILEDLKVKTADAGEKAKIDAEIFELNEEQQRNVIKNLQGMKQAHDELNESITGLNVRILELTGRHVEAAGIKTEQEFRDLRRRLEIEIADLSIALLKLSPASPEFIAATRRLNELLQANVSIGVVVDFAQIEAAGKVLKDKMSALQGTVDAEALSIDLAQATGLTLQEELSQRVIALHERQLAGLRRLRDEWLEMVGAIETNEEREQLRELEEQIGRVELALVQAREAAKILRNALRDSVQRGLETLLTSGLVDAFDTVFRQQEEVRHQIEATAEAIDAALEKHGVGVQERTEEIREFMQASSDELRKTVGLLDVLKEAFRSFAFGVVEALQQVIAQMISMRLVAAGINVLTGGLGGGTILPSGTAFAASGGLVFGPGTDTSDSIPARLSRGEYVVNARAVRAIGVDALNEINFGRQAPSIRRYNFAQGGPVQASGSSSSRNSLDSSLSLGLEDGLVLRHIETPRGQRTMVKVITTNRQAIRRALGMR